MILENPNANFKQFKPTSWSVKNRIPIYLLMIIVSVMGIVKFITLPKEQFPDVVIPNIYVQTIYVGNSPKDIENLVTQPIEKQIKGITGAKITKVTSTSAQDYSAIVVEFDGNVKQDLALQKVKDAVDKAQQDLPTDLTQQPVVQEINLSEQPIMYVNLSGNYDKVRLKKYAEDLQDKLEELPSINRVDIVGAPEREFQINVDNAKMDAAGVSFDNIANAVSMENMDISGGLIHIGDARRSLQLKGQFKTQYDIEEVVVHSNNGAPIYLRDIATIIDTVKENESYARLDGKNVITLNIVKRAGENLIETSEKVKEVTEEMKLTMPKDMQVTITGDSSKATKASFNELVNSIVIGFILVLIILMFFMGVTNAFFVALSVPLSMFVAFFFLPAANLIVGTDITLNFMVLFALLFGLGIIVDDAIVVIENTHRIFMENKGKVSSLKAAQMAAGEVFIPVLSGTVTTLAPFFPLLFWPGIIGKFMIYLPTMLIFTLVASLIVAFIMNPVFAVDFMNHPESDEKPAKKAMFKKPGFWIGLGAGLLFIIIGFIANANALPVAIIPGAEPTAAPGASFFFIGNVLVFMMLLWILNVYLIDGMIHSFQNRVLPALMDRYEKLLRWALHGWRPVYLLLSTFLLLILSIVMLSVLGKSPTFFPESDPNQIYVYLKLPVGTDVEYTDSVTRVLEKRVFNVLGMENGNKNPLVESVISNVAVGAGDPMSGDQSTRPELGRIQVSFVEYEKRHGKKTTPYLDQIRAAMKGIAGAVITVNKEQNGPPTEPPINIEIASEDFDNLIKTAVDLKNYLDQNPTQGVEELKMDIDITNPEITLKVDRTRANYEGVSTYQIGMALRTGLFGREVSKIKDGEDEYKIQLRNEYANRHNLVELLNQKIPVQSGDGVKTIPISSLVKVDFTSTLGSVKRKNYKRVITLNSNVLQGYTPTQVNAQLLKKIEQFHVPDGVTIKQTGEGEQQAETGAFLVSALGVAIALIIFTLVLQFNSISKAVIILTEILFSVIGVLIGYSITGMQMSVVMTGIGIVGLAGIVVKNGILVIEFAEELRMRGMKTRDAVIMAGKTRIIPVLLTALAAIMALIPLAVGFNINFVTLFSELNPHIFFGGDSTSFWKPLSWTLIFGLAFAFFMTLIMVPGMYLIAERLKKPMRQYFGGRWISFLGIPPFIFIFIFLMIYTMIRHRISVGRRRNKALSKDKHVDETFIGSWF